MGKVYLTSHGKEVEVEITNGNKSCPILKGILSDKCEFQNRQEFGFDNSVIQGSKERSKKE